MITYPARTLSGVGFSPPIIIAPTPGQPLIEKLGITCSVSPGAALTYKVQITGDVTPSDNGNWIDHDTISAASANMFGNVIYPISGIRLYVIAWTSGSANMGVVQWP